MPMLTKPTRLKLTIKNHSPYATKALRAAAKASVLRSMIALGTRHVTLVVVTAGSRKAARTVKLGEWLVRVPAPSGDEWVAQLRGVQPGHRVLTNVMFANLVRAAFGREPIDWAATPVAIPLAPLKPPPPKRDRVADKHARAVQLLAAWTRKRKLADNKVRKYARLVRYYERRQFRKTPLDKNDSTG